MSSQSSSKASAKQRKKQANSASQATKKGDGAQQVQLKTKTRTVGSAIMMSIPRGLGLQDLRNLRIAYLAGYIYVGNNTNGANDQVLVQDATSSNNLFVSPVPILPSDVKIGQTYVGDVFKHFMRRVYHRIRLCFLALQPSTSNSMVANVAPVRGGNILAVIQSGAAVAQLSQAGVMGMSGHKQFASWESEIFDLTPFIAGGSGAQQNEFNQANSAAAENPPTQASLSLGSPCGFAVSGTNSSAGLKGTNTHAIVIDLEVSLLDFIASILPGGTVAVGKGGSSDPRPFIPQDSCARTYTGDVKVCPDDKGFSRAVHASTRADPIQDDYVSFPNTDTVILPGGPPKRDPSRLESRKL